MIASYGNRSVLREANRGQVVALSSAWPLARHPILMFLNVDNLLVPHAAVTVARSWTPATVKTQSPLITIDELGRKLGHIAPKFPANLDTAAIRRYLLRTGASMLAAASGNEYSRALLERIRTDGGFELQNPRKHLWRGYNSREPLYCTIFRALRACLTAELPISKRLIRGGWFLVLRSVRAPSRKVLIGLRFAVKERPSWVEGLLSTMVNISAWRRSRTRK